MKKTIVDSNIWISHYVENNKIGKTFIDWFNNQNENNSVIIVTYGIITEVIAMVLKKKGFKKANRVIDNFIQSNKIKIYNNSADFFDEIIEIFKTYEVLSLIDAEIVLLYKSLNCNQLVTTDSGFNCCYKIDSYHIPQ